MRLKPRDDLQKKSFLGLSSVSVTNGPFIDGRTTGIEPARGGFTIHCLDPLGYIRPYPRTGFSLYLRSDPFWTPLWPLSKRSFFLYYSCKSIVLFPNEVKQSFKQRGWAVHFIDLTSLYLRLKRGAGRAVKAHLVDSERAASTYSYQNEKKLNLNWRSEPLSEKGKPLRVSASVFLLVSALPSAGFALSIHLFFKMEI